MHKSAKTCWSQRDGVVNPQYYNVKYKEVKYKEVKYKELMYRHCGTNNRAPRWTFMDPCKLIPINFKHGKFWCPQNATIEPNSTVELCYMCHVALTK